MKYYLFAMIITLVSLSGCTRTTPTDTTTPVVMTTGATSSWSMNSGMSNSGVNNSWVSTTGCMTGEILADWVCIAYTWTGKNIDLFNQSTGKTLTWITVSSGSLKGYYVEPTGSGNYPGVLMIHEWWGLNDNIKYMANLLAQSGYKVFAVDLYGEVTTDQTKAQELSTKVRTNSGAAIEQMRLALSYLKNSEKVTKIGTLGWCFGWGQSLGISLDTPVDATVIYYGNLSEDTAQLAKLRWPVLGIFGDKDTSIPLDKINLFKKNLGDLDKQNNIYVYPGLGHAFANPSGANYAPGEAVDAWDKTISFLDDNLK
jgi:carboxymethylenebutenolidase